MEAPEKQDTSDTKDRLIEVETTERVYDHSTSFSMNDTEKATAKEDQRNAEAKLVRRIDVLILPLLALAMMVGYLDRSNIGNARVIGMEEDLGLSDQQFLNIIMMFCRSTALVCWPYADSNRSWLYAARASCCHVVTIHPPAICLFGCIDMLRRSFGLPVSCRWLCGVNCAPCAYWPW